MSMTPGWASSQNYVGPLDPSTPLRLQVHLALHNAKLAETELAAISDPDDTRYGLYLSDDDFNSKYAPTIDDVATLRSHLEKFGLQITHVPDNRAFVEVAGTAGQVGAAFATRFGQFRVKTEVRYAPMDKIKMPTAVTSVVGTVLGLSTPVKIGSKMRRGGISVKSLQLKGKPQDAVDPNTCSEWFGQIADTVDPAYGNGYPALSYLPCGLVPAKLRQAYGVDAAVRRGNDGTGVNIAVVDAWTAPTLFADAQTYAAQHDPDYPLTQEQFTIVPVPGTPASPPDTGWYGEQSLDVEAVHAIAPGAHIQYVGANSNSDPDLLAALNLVISKRLASVISNSWEGLEDAAPDAVAYKAMAVQAGLKGIGLYFSSGDSGDEANDMNNPFMGNPTVDFPGSLPYVTAVGGTSLALGRDNSRVFEVGWESGVSFLTPPDPVDGGDAGPPTWQPGPADNFYFGAGGGTSMLFDQPTWQKGIVPDALASLPGAPARVVPDVAMLADPLTGFLIGQTDPQSGKYGEGTIGGTSLACPLFTATVALAQQNAKHNLGFANPLFYKASKKGAFTDVKPGAPQVVALPGGIAVTFDYHGAVNSIGTAAGYDNVTGLGTPNGESFLKAIK
jgi:subtilase family serine protease